MSVLGHHRLAPRPHINGYCVFQNLILTETQCASWPHHLLHTTPVDHVPGPSWHHHPERHAFLEVEDVEASETAVKGPCCLRTRSRTLPSYATTSDRHGG